MLFNNRKKGVNKNLISAGDKWMSINNNIDNVIILKLYGITH